MGVALYGNDIGPSQGTTGNHTSIYILYGVLAWLHRKNGQEASQVLGKERGANS